MPRAEGFNLFGELCAQPSRLAPDCAMDPAVGQLVASGLASAATLLCASLLRTAFKCVQLLSVFSSRESCPSGIPHTFSTESYPEGEVASCSAYMALLAPV